jgi:hypothetical protein
MCARVQEGLAAVQRGPVRCLGAEEAWASSDYSILTLCVSDGVGLDRPSPGETFWSLLGGEGGQLWGLMRRPRSPQTPKGRGKLCLLVSRLDSNARKPLGIGSLGLVFLCPGLGWHC